jgi:hypothetical protein
MQFHMDAYDTCTNLGEKILPIVLPSMVEAENFSDRPLLTILLVYRAYLLNVIFGIKFPEINCL